MKIKTQHGKKLNKICRNFIQKKPGEMTMLQKKKPVNSSDLHTFCKTQTNKHKHTHTHNITGRNRNQINHNFNFNDYKINSVCV